MTAAEQGAAAKALAEHTRQHMAEAEKAAAAAETARRERERLEREQQQNGGQQ